VRRARAALRESDFEVLDGSHAALTRDFNFTRAGEKGKVVRGGINGEVFDLLRVDARPELGSTEIWEFTTDVYHPVHLHLVHFKVLSRSNREPLPKDAGWKDTLDVPPGQIVCLLVRFDGSRGKHAFHCHNLKHEGLMMANFEVV
jgi:spore coat protein A